MNETTDQANMSANQVKISKTVYTITERVVRDSGIVNYTIKTGNWEKMLTFNPTFGIWCLWSAHRGLRNKVGAPKQITAPEFIGEDATPAQHFSA